MALYNDQGIVLRSYSFGEADKIVILLSPNRGKLRTVAKGVRKTKSRFGGRLETLTHVDLVLYEGKNLDMITQVSIIEAFPALRGDLDRVVEHLLQACLQLGALGASGSIGQHGLVLRFADSEEAVEVYEEEGIVYDELGQLIETQLKELLDNSCFDIDVVEVDVRDNTALIFIDGEDAALLIGKEGYRYNALSYMLFNWLHTKYELFIKLEIAEFLTSQQEMIRNYIKPVIENVEKHGRGKTRSLDGILVQIALEQLREAFPNKYVAVKTGREGNKFVVINEFNNKSNG